MKIILLILLIMESSVDSAELLFEVKYKKDNEKHTESDNLLYLALTISFLPPFLIYALAFGTIKNTFVLYLTLIMTCKSFFSFLEAYKLIKNGTYINDDSKSEIIVSDVMNLSYDIIVLASLLSNAWIGNLLNNT